MKKLTQEEKDKVLAEDYAEFLAEAERLKAEGKNIGMFVIWRNANRPSIKIAMTREEHFGSGKC
ncbi:MAG: hypothetical protein WAV95_17235 [Azonexus sp.]